MFTLHYERIRSQENLVLERQAMCVNEGVPFHWVKQVERVKLASIKSYWVSYLFARHDPWKEKV